MDIAPVTVRTYIARLRLKLGATTRSQLAVLALESGIFSDSKPTYEDRFA